jgi:aldose 1-epimerase
MDVSQTKFGKIDGQTVNLFTVKNDNGMELSCINYGCIITEILVPDMHGKIENIVLGFDTIEEYRRYSPYFGAVVGRVAGRIKNGQFELDGKDYKLTQNENQNHLHGGNKGFSHVLWNVTIVEKKNKAGIEFTYTSPDGEEGYPGNLEMKVTYILNNQNELVISYNGIPDEKTLLNVTNHTYFNLSGNLEQDILDHDLTMKSDRFLELNDELLPTGGLCDVEDTPFDFRTGRKIREGADSSHPQNILAGKGYDHPFLLGGNHKREIILADEKSGRKLVIETDEPGVVLYTGNQLEEDFQIRGVQSKKHLGICLETQGLPDSIHHPHFQSAILEKGTEYQSKTKYLFTVTK